MTPDKIFEELDFQPTRLGDLGVHEVTLADTFLMTSMFHAVEDAVSPLGLRKLNGIACAVEKRG